MAQPLVLFDVNGTLSDTGRLSQSMEEIGAPPQLAELWFASVLRDGFALAATGANAPFRELAEAALRTVLAGQPLNRGVDDAVAHVLAALQELPVHGDVADGIHSLAEAGVDITTLTNGARTTAEALFERAGLRHHVVAFLSVEDAPRWKPAPESYAYALSALGREAADVVLVAVHPWDIDGAARAGLRTAWLNRHGSPYPESMTRPDHEVSSVGGLVEVLAEEGSSSAAPAGAPSSPSSRESRSQGAP